MLRVPGVVATIALVDALNPSTIGPAIYLASGERARRSVLEFTIAVFLVHLAGGMVLTLGLGQLLRSVLSNIDGTARHIGELVFGIGILLAAGVLWHQRARLSRKEMPDPNPKRKASLALGASVIAVELPTAFPYFAAIAAILSSGVAAGGRVADLVLYNVCFVLPLIVILVTLLTSGARAQKKLERGRNLLQQRWPVVLAGVLLLGGTAVTALASVELAAS